MENEFTNLRQQLKEMKKNYLQMGQDLFKKEAQDLFEKNPDLKSFAWAQYTTYFNDGDTCYFGSRHYSPWVNGCRYEYSEDCEIEEIGLTVKRFDELASLVQKFIDAYDTDEDELKTWFGDHVKIIVTPSEVTIEDFSDHD